MSQFRVNGTLKFGLNTTQKFGVDLLVADKKKYINFEGHTLEDFLLTDKSHYFYIHISCQKDAAYLVI